MSIHAITTKGGKKRWKVRYRAGGVQHARHFDRKRDAETFDSEVRRRRQAGDAGLPTKTPTLAEYAVKWWDEDASKRLARTTLDAYAVALDRHLLPILGGYRLREITPRLVEQFLAKLRKEGVGDPTAYKAAAVLQAILKRALIEGLVDRNVAALVPKPTQRRKREPDLVPPETVEKIRAHLAQRDAALVSVLAYAGLRPESEAITLTWDRVGKRSLRIDATKTGKTRHVKLLAPLASDLQAWRKASSDTGLVFPTTKGSWSRHDWRNWLRRTYRPAAIAAGLPAETRPRDLRGSFASLLIWEGMNVVEVADQLGHTASTCLSHYAGVFAEFAVESRVSAATVIERARHAT